MANVIPQLPWRGKRPVMEADAEKMFECDTWQKSDAVVEVLESLHHKPAHTEGQNVVHGGC